MTVTTTTILKEKRIPEEPGVYIMKDSVGMIIYIGKAKNLRKRITS
jgi:excinuclease ABC subunit C